jgi:hypothetical protein
MLRQNRDATSGNKDATAVYLPPQNEAGTKTALNQLYKAISKEKKKLTQKRRS